MQSAARLHIINMGFCVFGASGDVPFRVHCLGRLGALIFANGRGDCHGSVGLRSSMACLSDLRDLTFVNCKVGSLPTQVAGLGGLGRLRVANGPLRRFPVSVVRALSGSDLLCIDLKGYHRCRINDGLFAGGGSDVNLENRLPRHLFLLGQITCLRLSCGCFRNSVPTVRNITSIVPRLGTLSLGLGCLSNVVPR